MPTLPNTWITQALEAAGINVTTQTIAIMRAWYASTPLPPYVNNPIGMPAGASGSPGFLNTGYAMFATPSAFYAAFATFIRTYQGGILARDMTADNPYPAAWRAIASLNWPGSTTETDYPAALLDLTSASYRESVAASAPSARRTSGVIGQAAPNKSAVIENARNLANAASAVSGASNMVRYLLQNGGSNG